MSGEKKNPVSLDDTATPDTSAEGGGDAAQTQISQQLRALYQSVQDEGIPERFLDLLQKLDEAEKTQSGRN